MNFLITYDISDPKRLRAVAKALERQARRVQKSVFIYTGSRKTLERIIAGIASHLDPAADRLQAWPIRTSTKSSRVDALAALPERGVAIVITNEQWLLIEAIDDPAAQDDEPLVIE